MVQLGQLSSSSHKYSPRRYGSRKKEIHKN